MRSAKYYVTRANNSLTELEKIYKTMTIDDFLMKNEFEATKICNKFRYCYRQVILNSCRAVLTDANINYKNIENLLYYVVENYDYAGEFKDVNELVNMFNFAVIIYDVDMASKAAGLLLSSLRKLVKHL
jgi:hypothetical protein